MPILEVAVLAVATEFRLSIGSVRRVAVYHPVAVIHGADKAAWTALLLTATAALTFETIVAGLVGIAAAETSAVAAASRVAGILR